MRGEGAVTGQEVEFDINFTTPFLVAAADHDFFRPEVGLSSGNFLWLSAPKLTTAPGNPLQFPAGTGDLQSWIRNDGQGGLAPDWERIGTDVTGQGPFNATFSLLGTAAPEPSGMVLAGAGLCACCFGGALRGRLRQLQLFIILKIRPALPYWNTAPLLTLSCI